MQLSEEEGEGSEVEARMEEGEGRQVETREEGKEAEEIILAEESCGRSRPLFLQDHPFLVKLRDYRTTRHGKGRSKGEAAQISAEVTRYLFFAQQSTLDQHLLLDTEAMNAYLKEIECAGMTPSTKRAKLNRLHSGMDFASSSC